MHMCMCRSSSEESSVSWEEATEFCFRSACWGLVNAIRAASMMTEHAISLSELRAVRLLFNKYDDELNGRMHASNLKPLLKVCVCCPGQTLRSDLSCHAVSAVCCLFLFDSNLSLSRTLHFTSLHCTALHCNTGHEW